MDEKIWDSLYTVGKVLHWLGKYDEANACTLLARLLKQKGIEKVEQLEEWVEREAEAAATRESEIK